MEQGRRFGVIVRDPAKRSITYQFMGMGAESCAPSGFESSLTAAFDMTGIYILSVFADGQQA